MILASHLMGLKHTEFLKSFEIAIQVGTILSVVVLYWRSLLVDFEVIKRLAVAFYSHRGSGADALQVDQRLSAGLRNRGSLFPADRRHFHCCL